LIANFEEEVGVEKFGLTNLKIYPNPTTGQMKIECEKTSINDIEIFDIYGRKLSSHHLSD
jgi:hypothetical protein